MSEDEQRPGDAARRALRAARGRGAETGGGESAEAGARPKGPAAPGTDAEQRVPRASDAARLALRAAAVSKEAEQRDAEAEADAGRADVGRADVGGGAAVPDAGPVDAGGPAPAAVRPGARPGDVAREALRAARAEARRAEAAAAEASEGASVRAVRRLPSPTPAESVRGRTAHDLRQFLATAFRMPKEEPEPNGPAPADAPADQATSTAHLDEDGARPTAPQHSETNPTPAASAAASDRPRPTVPAPAASDRPQPTPPAPAASQRPRSGTPASVTPPGHSDPTVSTPPAPLAPLGSPDPHTPASTAPAGHPHPASSTSAAALRPPVPTGSASTSGHPEPEGAATTPRLPRTMATPHRDSELRRTFPSLPSRVGAAGADFAGTWWGNAWVRALEEGALDVQRLVRGRGYAERGHVDAITVTPGLVLAYVQGSRPRPYRVQVRLRTFGEDEWERFLAAAADRPADIAALLDKELPQALAESGVPLLPGPGELEPRCSCPDFGHPCKHAAALCYQTARLLDADPFVLLLLRGRGEREVLDALSRRNAARAARERQPVSLPGVRATEALAPRQLPPLPPPLPVPSHPEQPPVYPGVPGGPDPFTLDQLATDAAARAHALLATGRDPVGELTLWQDAVRLAAARPGSGLTASTRALYASLADAVGRTPGDLARAVAAWRQGGPEGLAVLEEPWDPPAGRFDRARPLLLAADLPAFRPWRNHLTHPGGHVQLRLGRDGLWYAYESEPGHDDWWPRGTPDLDPVGALTGLGATDDL
ncbi:SWIM zinc finger family protein [Streptomyces sp. NPDC007157]|uniref:SWIM zinc finger family protein n=1 Tax=Streptomyces sp. NPDC007157 TaxID=3154681 RepID=UPI0033D68864